jgi:pentatricopeptide repeat protein
MKKVEDFESAKKILDEMKEEGIKPNEITYSTLMNKVEDFGSGKKILDEMKEEGINPSLFSYSKLFTKVIKNELIRDIHLWYVKSQDFHPSGPIEGLIKSQFDADKINDVYYLILHYPHLTISKKILSQDINGSLKLLESFSNENYYNEHINYVKGILYNLHNRYSESSYFLHNINLGLQSPKKISDIQRLLKDNEFHSAAGGLT